MNKLLVLVLAPLVSIVATAHAQLVAGAALNGLPTTLQATMREMSDDLKTITSQASDPAKNSASAQVAADLVAMTEHSKDFIPDTVAALPQDQQPSEMEAYKNLLDKVADEGRALEAAFQNNENAAVPAILQQMKQDKEDGHDRFR